MCTWSTRFPRAPGAVEFFGNELAEPGQDGLWLHDRSDTFEGFATEFVSKLRQPDAFGVVEHEPASDPEDTNLFIAP